MAAGAENKKMEGAIHAAGFSDEYVILERPSSLFIPVTKLIEILSKSLADEKICLMKEIQKSFIDKTITRQEMIRYFRSVVGDDMLASIIKSYTNELKAAFVIPKSE